MISQRNLEVFEEMLLIHSPSKEEKEMADYVISFLERLGAEIFLDESQHTYGGNSPVIFAKIKGDIEGEGVSLNAHTDVIQPNKDLKIVKKDNIWSSDGTTTLGGDDKAGLAAILTAVEYIVENKISHEDIYVIVTPGEEQGMLGARNINWQNVYQHIQPAKNMIVADNAGKANKVAYQAPTCYRFSIEIKGRKAHAGIEPEKGINAIQVASRIIAEMPLLRIDDETTANVSQITSDFPNNVVPDSCIFTGEIRSHSQDKVQNLLQDFETIIKKYTDDYSIETRCDYPALSSQDDLKFVKEIVAAYETVGVKAEPQIIGGGSDANFFAEEGFNSAIVGVGMEQVHTTEEYLDTHEMIKTTKALINYLSK
ncbi:M20/M25/M40 family metallo-hydrolase [Facklamia miroungae]|uniref:Tripeptide aminopeptidase n=1 Tax=Facklamia miroungae TaxID=120956 RepID=A0A1G7PIJ4_9LACT|nr:M20/M25/M40 family metallo-hydrolase [Facklamia miroungae]NKZ28706.1 M20/M25/M40 family metallo-hydrolase [Facklamia miroungae]SDF85489.1 tripeptide aminopeptidase [Facklamia miroungae]